MIEGAWSLAVAGATTALYLWAGGAEPLPAGGLVGHGIGIAGLLLMLFAWVGYSWRKRPERSGPGSMRSWLRLHVIAGIVGPYLVLLHGAFVFRGLAGIVSALVLVVVASGVVGRFAFTRSERARPALAGWWLLHVPLSAAMLALAVVHVVGALYYATLSR